jgi:hypothetical protein
MDPPKKMIDCVTGEEFDNELLRRVRLARIDR